MLMLESKRYYKTISIYTNPKAISKLFQYVRILKLFQNYFNMFEPISTQKFDPKTKKPTSGVAPTPLPCFGQRLKFNQCSWSLNSGLDRNRIKKYKYMIWNLETPVWESAALCKLDWEECSLPEMLKSNGENVFVEVL